MAELEDLLQALSEERYLQLSGLKVESSARSLFEGHPGLLDHTGWGKLLRGLGDGSRARVGGSLLKAYLDHAMAGPLDSMLETEAGASLEMAPEGPRVNLRRAPMEISRIEERGARAEAHLRWQAACDPLAGSCEAALANAAGAAGKLGFNSLTLLIQRALGLELQETSDQGASLIAATTDIYGDILSWLLKKRCGVAFDLAEEHDIEWLAGPVGPAPPVDFKITYGRLMKGLEALGLADLDGGRLAIDLEFREGKVGVPFLVPLRVPGRVIVAGEEIDSLSYSKLFAHELGRALSYAHMAMELPFEDRYLVDPALTHAWGYLFDGIYLDAKWIGSLGGDRLQNDWFPLGGALDLLRHRRDAALTGALTPGGQEPLHAAAVSGMESAQMVKSSGIVLFRSLSDLIDPVYRLRGISLGLALREHFRDRFGEDWYNNAEAGALMLSLWRRGGTLSVESLAAELGLGVPDSSALVAEAEGALGRWL